MPKRHALAAGQHGPQADHLVDRLAVDDGARAGRVVAGHAADGRLIDGGGVWAELEAVGSGGTVERGLDNARLHARHTPLRVDVQDGVQAEAVDQDAAADRLPGRAGTRAARAPAARRSGRRPRPRPAGRRPSRRPAPRPAPAGSSTSRWSTASARAGWCAPRRGPRAATRPQRRGRRRWARAGRSLRSSRAMISAQAVRGTRARTGTKRHDRCAPARRLGEAADAKRGADGSPARGRRQLAGRPAPATVPWARTRANG